jgi:hypothetical protein
MRLLTSLVALIVLACGVHAQDGKGAANGLRGVRRVYVDAGSNLRNRELIEREIRKAGLGFELLPSREGAEVVLFFASEKLRTATGVETRPPVTTGVLPDKPEVIYEDLEFGTGMAYAPEASGGGRVLFRWEGRRKFAAKAATKFASAFVKEYKRANRT